MSAIHTLTSPARRRTDIDELGGKPRVLAYLRVSSDHQVEEGYSLETQQQLVCDWCERQFGPDKYDLTIERDEGVSGSLGWAPHGETQRFRPGLKRAAERLEAGTADYFVVYRSDRAFRNHLEHLQFRQRFFGENSSCRFVSLTEAIDLDTKTGRLSSDLLSLFAEYQRELIRDNVRDGLASRRRAGFPTGDIGYGWRRTPRQEGSRPSLERDPERAPIVRRVYDLYRAGWGVRIIARELERLAAPLPGKSGRWSGSSVKALLKNPLHAGYIRDRGELRQGVHFEQRIVEPEEYLQVQAEMKRRTREPSQSPNTDMQPLYRVARCGTCGGLLAVVEEASGPAYRCRGSADRGDVLPDESTAGTGDPPASADVPPPSQPWGNRWCGGWHKAASLLNEELLSTLESAVRHPQFLRLAEDEARALILEEGRLSLARRKKQLTRALQGHQTRRERLTRGYTNGVIEEEVFQKLYVEIKADLDQTQADLAETDERLAHQEDEEKLLAQVRERLPQVRSVWEGLLPEERRQFIRDLTEYVVVDRLRAGRLLLRVKIPYLDELRSEIGHGKSRDMGFAQGVAGLSRRELALLCLLSEGSTFPEIRERWRVNTGQLSNLKRSILHRLGVVTLEQAVELAAQRICAERSNLPLDIPTTTPRDAWRPSERQRIEQVLDGYRGGLTREEVSKELGLALQTVRAMEFRARKLFAVETLDEAIARLSEAPDELRSPPKLIQSRARTSETERIGQVVAGYQRGLTREEMATELGLSVSTIRTLEYRGRKRCGCATLEGLLQHWKDQLST